MLLVLAVVAALLPVLSLSAAPASADVPATGNRIFPTTWESRVISPLTTYGLNAARSAFNSGATSPGVCKNTNARTLNGQSNRTFCPGGRQDNYAFRIDIPINSADNASWRMRIAPDNGFGGGMLVDGVDATNNPFDMYDPNFSGTPGVSYFDITRTFSAGAHTLTLFGAEGCCDGASGAQVMMPGSNTWTLLGATPDVKVTGISNGDSVSYTAAAPRCSATPFGGSTNTFSAVIAGATKPVGPTTATCTYNDPTGGTGTAVATYTRFDDVKPNITGSATQTFEATSTSGATVSYVKPTASDIVDGPLAVNCSQNPGTAFAFGSTPVTCTATDAAGNSNNFTTTIVVRDTKVPVVTGKARTNAVSGWYRGDVTVDWTVTDTGSGVAPENLPAPSVLIGEGRNQTATASATDRFGNRGTGTSPAVSIDRTAPVTTLTAPQGWVKSATVQLSAYDGLSGVASSRLYVNDVLQPARNSYTFASSGTYTLRYASTDIAGNAETERSVTVTVDATAPSITAAADATPNASGWYRRAVRVSFTCTDTGVAGGVSGVATCTDPIDVTTDGTSIQVGNAVDNAGNSAQAALTVPLDTAAPSIEGTLPPAGDGGWYRAPVTAEVTCVDPAPKSGVVTCTSSTLSEDTAAGDVVLHSTDAAGNATTRTLSGVKLDGAAPTVALSLSDKANSAGWINSKVTATPVCDDALSGIAACAEATTLVQGAGQTVTAEAVDNAGNRASTSLAAINVDTTPPAIAAVVKGTKFGNYYISKVTVEFTCDDDLSGIASCPQTVTLDSEGLAEPILGTVTDKAGNTTSTTVSGLALDLVDPTITALPARAPGASGWYTGPVDIAFSCTDTAAGSGYVICPPIEKLTTDGKHSFTVTAVDAAGRSTERAFGPYLLDGTAPTLTGAATTEPNDNGWYRNDVTVDWTATDAISGVTNPASSTITGEGPGLVAQADATDVAGNNTRATSEPVRIDRTAPATALEAPTSWLKDDITLTLDPADALSGVADTTYTLDGAATQHGTKIAVAGEGVHTVAFSSVDKAGNVETTRSATVKIDKTVPTISGTRDPEANAAGWNRTPVTVTFDCADTGGSTLASCTHPVTVDTDTVGTDINGTAVDTAGNSANAAVLVKLDRIDPTISALVEPGNAANWHNAPVSVGFTCRDTLPGSGVASCTQGTVVNTEGAGQVFPGAVSDRAGNTGNTTTGQVNIDLTAPTISGAATSKPTGTNEWYTKPVTVHFACEDALSGVKSCTDDVELSTDTASKSVAGSSSDVAGNSATTLAAPVKIDQAGPTVEPSLHGTVGSNGIYTGPVTVTFDCADATSGIASCPAPVVVDADGMGQSVKGTAVDKAGNSTTVST
ncbi:MAG: hypothetical protein JWM64_1577, partial [Frankiales bacterium]|nr:hypothetical protein [Frankiales bacterium]